MNKTQILKEFMNNLKRYFQNEGSLCVQYMPKVYFSDDMSEKLHIMCGDVRTDDESVFFNLGNEKFYYEGETGLGEISGNTTFEIDDCDLNILPEPLRCALKRVGYAENWEIYQFDSNSLLPDI